MESNKRQLAIMRGKRTPETLEDWAKVFGEGDQQKAKRYALAIATFIGTGQDTEWSDYLGQHSPNTRKAYSFAVAEFFEWAAAVHKRVVPPHLITRKDAEDYVSWLANRTFSLAEEKLKDGDMETKRQLFEIVKGLGTATLSQVVKKLPRHLYDEYLPGTHRERAEDVADSSIRDGRLKLSRDIRSMVTMDVLTASPTVKQIRKDHPNAGISTFDIPTGKGNERIPLEDMFTYSVLQYKPVGRTTIALRISALSTLWKILMQGENIEGGEAILKYDIWGVVKGRVNRGIAPAKRAAARKQKVPTEVVLRMMRDAPTKSLVQLRDKAILYLIVFSGIRTTELIKLRRGKVQGNEKMPYFDGSEPPAIQVLRKGNKWMRLPYPPAALKPLIEFQQELDKRAASVYAQFEEKEQEGYLERGDIGYYFRDLMLPDAPLFPSVYLWGKNVRTDYRKSMSRINLYKLLQKVAENVGLSEDLVSKVHPHAIRHFSANAMVEGGKDLREVQHILGHTSITTTEGYLEDVEDEVKLSGQSAILDFLDAQGVQIEATHDGTERPDATTPTVVIDTYATEIEQPEVVYEPVPEPITDVEVVIISELTEKLPSNELPMLPAYVGPEVNVIDTSEGEILDQGPTEGLVGLTAETEDKSQELLDGIMTTINNGVSPSSPEEVYEALATKGDYEPVVFQRGGQKNKEFLDDNYPKMPKNFGVGINSLLPWYVKAKGNISSAGFFKGLAPFPVWAPEQVTPETVQGSDFIEAVEELYVEFMSGDVDAGIAPSPIRSVGLIKWFGFFSYNSRVFEKAFDGFFSDDTPNWGNFSEAVPIRDLRMHKKEWLMMWLRDNAHTFRASVDAMKRGVPMGAPRGAEKVSLIKAEEFRDPESYFLKASFEGIDLIEKMPEWMIYDDPVNALYQEDPKEFEEFITWLRNVTGQALSRDREEDRSDQKKREENALLKKAESVRDILKIMYEERDVMAKAKRQDKEEEWNPSRDRFRQYIISYLLKASGNENLLTMKDSENLKSLTVKKFTSTMTKYFDDTGIPDPNDKKYKSIKGVKARITAIVKELFPNQEVLSNANIFADSDLFNPQWFRIDEKAKTIRIEEKAAEDLQNQYGLRQSPQLLVRRAARAMYEAREKRYDKLWGVMMSYFSWIVPTGVEMESEVKGIPITSQGFEGEDVEERQRWFQQWTKDMRALADGESIHKALKDTKQGDSGELAALMAEQAGDDKSQFFGDVMDHATSGLDMAAMASSNDWQADSPEGLMIEAQEGDYYPNTRAGLMRNGKSAYLHMQGEKPKGWYKVDLHGGSRGYKRNAAPVAYMSPGVLYNTQKKVEPARLLLPSPFRMMAAMRLE